MPNNSYIGAVQVNEGEQALIGSTLFGVCEDTAAGTAAKVVTLASFDQLLNGVTVQVRFVHGNTVASGVTLKINTTDALPVAGNCLCEANQVIAFTYENVSGVRYWRSHHNISGAMPITGGTFTGSVSLSSDISQSSPSLSLATKKYVDDKTAGLSGLTGAMHFKGEVNTLPEATAAATFNAYDAGDVVLVSGSAKEYVYAKGNNAASSQWIELGDEGSWALNDAVIHNSLLSAKGDLIYGEESGNTITPARLPIGTGNNKFLTIDNGVPVWGTVSKEDIGLTNVTNDAQIPKSVGTTAGDIIYYNGSSFVRLGIGSAGEVLKVNNAGNAPYWTTDNNSDTKVTQSGITANEEYAILLKNTTGTSNETDGVNFVSTTGKLVTINPSTGIITAGGFSGNGSGLTNVVASSVDWTNVTNKVTATLNTLGIVKTTSTVSDATNYTASPIINGVVYYQDTDTHYTSSGSANAVTSINLTYTTSSAQNDTVSTTATAIGVVSQGILYIKSISQGTTAVSTGVSVDNT